jgi:hypothetical protein
MSSAFGLSLLVRMSVARMRSESLFDLLEEFWKFERVLAGNVVEGSGGDVVCLSFADERVVLKEVSQLRGVEVRLSFEDFLRFVPTYTVLAD